MSMYTNQSMSGIMSIGLSLILVASFMMSLSLYACTL